MSNDELERRRAALQQHLDHHDGLITRDDLLGLGYSSRELAGMIGRRELIWVRRGLYRARGARRDLQAAERGGLMKAPKEGRLVLGSALHRMELLRYPPAVPQIGVPGRSGVDHRDGYDLHRTVFAERPTILVDRLPCSRPGDAIEHFAGGATDEATRRMLRRALREAARREPALPDRLREVAEDAPRRRGSKELRDALNTVTPGTLVVNSDMEEDFLTFLRVWGLPLPVTNHLVDGHEYDCAWLLAWLLVELDTRRYHASIVDFDRDRQRRRQVAKGAWKLVELTNVDLAFNPADVAGDLAQLLGLTDWRAPVGALAQWNLVVDSAVGVWAPIGWRPSS